MRVCLCFTSYRYTCPLSGETGSAQTVPCDYKTAFFFFSNVHELQDGANPQSPQSSASCYWKDPLESFSVS